MKPTTLLTALACCAMLGVAHAQTGAGTKPAPPAPTQTKPPATQKPSAKAGQEGALSAADRSFVMEAAMGGLAEVDFGQLATQKAASADVKQFGQRMVDDHGKANDELKSLATQKNVTLPASLDAKHKATHDRLDKLSGDAFDRAYMREMVADHNQDVAAFAKHAKSAADPDLKAWAGKTLPTLQEHQKMAKEISAKLSPSKTAPGKK